MAPSHSLIIADANTLMLQALSDLFERDRRFSLVATSKTAEGFLESCLAVAAGRMVFPYVDVRSLKRDPRESLTTREKALLVALAKGRTNTELATELGISINTVKFHLRNLYEKLGLRNRAQAIAFHYANGV